MPKATAGDKAMGGSYKPHNLQWVNPTPNQDDLEWLESNGDHFVEVVFTLFEDIQEAERLSVKRDPQSSRWLAVLFAGDGDTRNAGHALSVRGATPFDALILLAYFHSVRYGGEYPIAADSIDGRWG